MRLNFNSIKTHTQNILINLLQFSFHFQNVQNHLQRFYNNTVKKRVNIYVFMQINDFNDIVYEYKKVQTK